MNAKHLTALAVLAAVSVATTAWVLRASSPTVAADRRGETVVPSLMAKRNDIISLSIRDGSDTLAIERRDNRFVAADSGYPIKTDAVGDVIVSCALLSFQEARTSNPARYGDLGLADPGAKDAGKEITFRTASGELADLLVGNSDPTVGGPAGGVFIRLKGQPQTFLARGNVRLPSGRSDWFVPFDPDIKSSAIKKVELAGGGRDGVIASANAEKPGTFVLADLPEKRTADSNKVTQLTTFIDSFTFNDVRKATKSADDARRMVVETSDDLHLIITAVGDLTQGWVQIAAQAKSDAAKNKAQMIDSKVAGYEFRLPEYKAGMLGWTISDLTSEKQS
ncbi:MAG TPA: DUF4340 domain-containing protein [Xanthobacteraceae bacterium]|nr:DUF4340 domain-containing protein [Xanthobacteraceae bacterium]